MSVPWMCWLTPMPQKIIAARARAKLRATSRIVSGVDPAERRHPLRCEAADVRAKRLEALGEAVEVLPVEKPLLDDHVHDRVEQRHVGAGPELQHPGGMPLQPHAARVHDDQLAAALGELLEVGRGHRMVLGGVGADDDGEVGVLDLVEGRRDRARADVLHQRRHRRGVAEPGAVVDVVVAEPLADQLLEEIRLLVRALGAAEPGHGRAAVRAAQPVEPARRGVQRLVPARLAEVGQRVRRIDVQPLGRRVVAADQRACQPVRMRHVVEAEASLDAEPALVRRAVHPVDPGDPPVLDLVGDLAADPAIGADRLHLALEVRLSPRPSRSSALASISAPVGQACTHSPQATQVDAPIGSAMSKTMARSNPRPAMPITSFTCTSRQARTQRLQWMQASRFTRIATWLSSASGTRLRGPGREPAGRDSGKPRHAPELA